MNITLNVPERIAGLRLLNEAQSSLSLTGLKSALELLGILTLSKEEQEEIGFKDTVTEREDGTSTRQLTWENSSYEKELEVTDEQREVLQDLIKTKDKQKKFTMQEGMAVVQLAEKLK